uniref:Uncharacterized protein n=1 Tax=Tanacetum cinerariifolium TaxID=118510 RepID=A0A6L2P2N6_TANCI|nr:hypothetical protein [Tanacetum cinerariifolium]
MIVRDNEIKVLGEVNVELESGSKKLREKLRQEEDTEEEAFEEFSSTLDNVLGKLSYENESPGDFYGLMYDMDDDASISGNSYLDFAPPHDSFRSRNKIFDLEIFIEVQSERLLSWEEFSISFIRDPLYPVFDTLLPLSFENKDKVFKPGILSYLFVSHRDKITSNFSENPMMMYEGDISLLDVLIAPDLEASRAHDFVQPPLELQSLAYGNPIS